ncbi:unnamed protein product, partial [marine sediment metagenome]
YNELCFSLSNPPKDAFPRFLLTHFTEAQEAEGGTEDLVLTFPKDQYIVDTWYLTGN